MKNFFSRLKFWIEWSRYLNCKQCCLRCPFYKECVAETEDLLEFYKMY